jgi:hypothetical protein
LNLGAGSTTRPPALYAAEAGTLDGAGHDAAGDVAVVVGAPAAADEHEIMVAPSGRCHPGLA